MCHNRNKQSESPQKNLASDCGETVSNLSSNIKLTTSYGIDAHGAFMTMKDGQWIPPDGATITGEIDLMAELDGELLHFPSNISGTKLVGNILTYLCENGESFFLINNIPYVIMESDYEFSNMHMNSLVCLYRKYKTKVVVWEIWKLKSMN